MTMREFARLANVSVSTVSKAFHGAEDISDETRSYIFELAKKHGCYGKFFKGRFPKKVIAILCAELNSGHYSDFVTRLQKFIEDSGHIAIVASDHFNGDAQGEMIDYFVSYIHVDAIFVLGLRTHLKREHDIPIVSLFSSVDRSVDSVNIDMEGAMREAFALLYNLGHRDIAFLGEPLTQTTQSHFFDVSKEYPDVTVYHYIAPERFQGSGESGVREMLLSGKRASALICAYDEIAFGAIKELKRNGISVPEDISVVGIDNIHATAYTETTLTSVDLNLDEVCLVAWDLLQKKMGNKFYKSPQQIRLSTKLIIRESVGEAKKN